jgi:hypothetical protein
VYIYASGQPYAFVTRLTDHRIINTFDLNSRFPGHPESVDALAVFDDDTLITGSFDGVVRVCLAWLRFNTKA